MNEILILEWVSAVLNLFQRHVSIKVCKTLYESQAVEKFRVELRSIYVHLFEEMISFPSVRTQKTGGLPSPEIDHSHKLKGLFMKILTSTKPNKVMLSQKLYIQKLSTL